VPCSGRRDSVGEGKERFMGEATAFDMMLGIMVSSIVSWAITGNAPMDPALVPPPP
jgi:hypothetical protein